MNIRLIIPAMAPQEQHTVIIIRRIINAEIVSIGGIINYE